MGWSRNPDLLYKQHILNDCWQGNFSLHLHTMPHVSLRSWGLAQVIEAGVTWLLLGGLAPHSGSCHQLIKICWGEIWPRFHRGPSLPAALKQNPKDLIFPLTLTRSLWGGGHILVYLLDGSELLLCIDFVLSFFFRCVDVSTKTNTCRKRGLLLEH